MRLALEHVENITACGIKLSFRNLFGREPFLVLLLVFVFIVNGTMAGPSMAKYIYIFSSERVKIFLSVPN